MNYDDLLRKHPDINVIDYTFESDHIKGLYCDGTIAINKDIKTTAEKTCVLAEELGHHYTSAGNIINLDNTSNRKQEHIARMWSYNKLINLQGFIDAFEYHCTNLYETAEYLGVTEKFLIETINAYMHKYGCYVRYKKYIIEFNFNSVNVIKRF